jgi:hypothetical protein
MVAESGIAGLKSVVGPRFTTGEDGTETPEPPSQPASAATPISAPAMDARKPFLVDSALFTFIPFLDRIEFRRHYWYGFEGRKRMRVK